MTALQDPIVEQVDAQGVRDFSSRRKPVVFRIDGDLFHGVPDLPGEQMIDLAALAAKTDDMASLPPDELKDLFRQQIELVLVDADAARYLERMKSKTEPISLEQTMELLPWLMEKYGMRPTEPSGDSSAGSPSPDGGTNATASGPPEALPPRAYLQPISST
jgi:hypothetical protein